MLGLPIYAQKNVIDVFGVMKKKWAFDLEWDYNLVGPDVNGPDDIHVEASEVERYLDENKP